MPRPKSPDPAKNLVGLRLDGREMAGLQALVDDQNRRLREQRIPATVTVAGFVRSLVNRELEATDSDEITEEEARKLGIPWNPPPPDVPPKQRATPWVLMRRRSVSPGV